MKNIKASVWAVVFILFLFTFTSCARSSREIRDNLFVESCAIDVFEDEVTVTMQAFNPISGGGDQNGAIVTSTLSAKGASVEECADKLNKENGKKLSFDRIRYIVMSAEAMNDFEKYFKFFINENYFAYNLNIILSEGRAEDIVKVSSGDDMHSAGEAMDIIKKAADIGGIRPSTAADIINSRGGNVRAHIPVMKVEDGVLSLVGEF